MLSHIAAIHIVNAYAVARAARQPERSTGLESQQHPHRSLLMTSIHIVAAHSNAW